MSLAESLVAIVGETHVLVRPAELIVYESDGLPGYHRRPSLAVFPANADEALRVVRAGLAISLVPREVANIYAEAYGLKVVPMAEPWAKRRFIICYRDAAALSPSAQLLAEHLAARAQLA